MSSVALDRPVFRTISLDVVLCAAVVAVPALSHAAAFPFYLYDPMRLLLFVAILASSRRNALLMAVMMPLLAMLTSGHPVFPKVMLIQGELVLNTLIFFGLARRTHHFAPAAVVSIVASKIAYYAAKFLLIKMSLLGGSLIATSWTYQLGTLLFIVLVGALVWNRLGRGAVEARDQESKLSGRS